MSLMDTLRLIETFTGKRADVEKIDAQKGDVRNTWADITKAKELIGYQPKTLLEEGLKQEIVWIKKMHKEWKSALRALY